MPELMDRFGGKLFNFSLKFCGNREDAEDLVQETFSRRFASGTSSRGARSRRSALHDRSARLPANAAQARGRAAPDRLARCGATLGHRPDRETAFPRRRTLDEGLRTEAVAIVDKALARLPVKYRLPLVLKEIGDVVGRDRGHRESQGSDGQDAPSSRASGSESRVTERLGRPKESTEDHAIRSVSIFCTRRGGRHGSGSQFPVANKEDLCDAVQKFVESSTSLPRPAAGLLEESSGGRFATAWRDEVKN